jgi:hypothetical protein
VSDDSGVAGDGERDAVAVADDEDMEGECSGYITLFSIISIKY